ncbi:MAG: hypothetical protein L0Z46_10245 [Nitrospiraceae bacterium]|nr:hypothetical protein [Nitrospiraceae bacterium]
MLVYMIYDKSNGKIVHIHRAVDAAGRSCTCTEEEVMRVLPTHIDAKSVGIVSTEMEEVPSGRQTMFSVNVATGALIKTPVATVSPKGRK